ncbi:OmpA family protein [Sinomicrobium soli]|uniref:OmpA family protein n=1 Tax=Sinomicrobium sp. N-1-3-6 TaxID=2219864 RepID=UPI000DCBA32F|nr:OmpA family protein [Sinomicrobium sp. N-1-3-6]RAV27755.1 flagellar motor protein MotB [Sinomicrobium sp. N-1-3-6]
MNRRLLTIVLAVFAVSAWSQERRKEKADKDYGKYAYISAGEMYEALVEQGFGSAGLYGKLADTYYFNARYEEALKHYEKMFSYGETEIPDEYYYRYGQCLRVSGRKAEADRYIARFYEKTGQSPEDVTALTGAVATLADGSARYRLQDAGINTGYADFSTAYYGDGQVVISSARDTGVLVKRRHKWNVMPFLKLYTADINEDGTLSNPQKIRGGVNSKYHQTTAAVTRDGKTMYFTRNNYRRGNFGKDEDGTNHLKIYRATFDGKKWTGVEDLPINDDAYSTAHPALSADETHLYFVSDRPGSLGDTDIFRVGIEENGSLGTVEHLGEEINTPGKETFPYLDEEGQLYFASGGHSGFGGLDVFTVLEGPFGKSRIVNLGPPVNTERDDFGFVMRKDGTGFLSSNRGEKSGFDNIYSVSGAPISLEATLCGRVIDSVRRTPVAGAEIGIRDKDNEILATVSSDADGRFCVPVWPFEGYNLRTTQTDYLTREQWVTPLGNEEKRELLVELVKDRTEFTTGDDLTEKLGLKPIYFDFDGSSIRKVSEIELGKVIAVLKKYPELRVDVRSHTDSRGSHAYNEALSERRAKSTINYILEKGGISPDRVSGKGYGETRLVNGCADGVTCSEKEHQLNRRSEFIVMKL